LTAASPPDVPLVCQRPLVRRTELVDRTFDGGVERREEIDGLQR